MNLEKLNLSGICMGCLNFDRKMYYSDRIKEYFKLLANIDINDGLIVLVCWECTAYINTVHKFRTTIEKSYQILLDYSMKDESAYKSADIHANAQQRFEISTNELVECPPEGVKIEASIKEECLIDPEPREKTKGFDPELILYEDSTNNSLLSKNKYVCDYCGQNYDKKLRLVKHIMFSHLRRKTLKKCNLCSYKTRVEFHFKRHVLTHTGVKPFSCDSCPYRCTQMTNLNRHVKMMHRVENRFSCELCSFVSSNYKALKQHAVTHASGRIYKCDSCLYVCIDKWKLKRHILSHIGEKKFSCKLCSYKTIDKSYLRRHERTHTGEKTLSC